MARWGEPLTLISLIKPHYEVTADEKQSLSSGVLPDDEAERIARRTYGQLPAFGVENLGLVESPLRGSPKKNKPEGVGNKEWLALLRVPKAEC